MNSMHINMAFTTMLWLTCGIAIPKLVLAVVYTNQTCI